LRSIPDKLLGVVAMFGAIFILFLLPWLDSSKVRSATFRPIYKQLFWIFLADYIILGWCGAQHPEGAPLIIGRIATAYYFIHFLVLMPLVSKFEKPRALPESISTPVLKTEKA
ncbi:MAG TPA: cytochrome b, partial [Solimonas sp.]